MAKPKRLKEQNYFFLGILLSVLVSIATNIWSDYFVRFCDMLPYNEPFRTQLTVGGGLVFILILIFILWKLSTKRY